MSSGLNEYLHSFIAGGEAQQETCLTGIYSSKSLLSAQVFGRRGGPSGQDEPVNKRVGRLLGGTMAVRDGWESA